MPSKKRKDGTYKDIAHPINNETRRMIEEKIIAEYQKVLAEGGSAKELEDE
jgi:stage V sporulation protein G